jgi:pilus assembly protein CpaB
MAISRQSMIALAAALVLGLFAVYVANSWLNVKQQQVFAAGTTKIAVAAAPLGYGTDVTSDKVRFVDYPNSSIPPGAFTDAAQLTAGKKRVALMPIAVNEPILKDKISAQGQGPSIAALLSDGKRAASVHIDDVSGVSGFIMPNDAVDVLVTRQIAANDREQQVTDVLLQNVRVIAIDQQAKNPDGSPKASPKTATLEVTPLDAQKLALAQQVGDLSLVLRKPGEENNPVVETVSLNDLRYNMYGGARYPAPAVVGSYGGSLSGAVSGAMMRSATQVASTATPRSTRPWTAVRKKPAAPARPKQIQVYRGTKSDQVDIGG